MKAYSIVINTDTFNRWSGKTAKPGHKAEHAHRVDVVKSYVEYRSATFTAPMAFAALLAHVQELANDILPGYRQADDEKKDAWKKRIQSIPDSARKTFRKTLIQLLHDNTSQEESMKGTMTDRDELTGPKGSKVEGFAGKPSRALSTIANDVSKVMKRMSLPIRERGQNETLTESVKLNLDRAAELLKHAQWMRALGIDKKNPAGAASTLRNIGRLISEGRVQGFANYEGPNKAKSAA